MSKKKSNQIYSEKTDNQKLSVVDKQQYFFSSNAEIFDKPTQEKQLNKIKDFYLLIGTPNVGKSTFFNKVSKATASVSNIDRLTTSSTVGKIKKHKNKIIVDLPGIYNLSHPIDEEVVVAKQICDSKFKKIINVIGAQSIQRDLILTIQAIETGLMSTLIINMVDEVNHESLDIDKFSKYLNNITVIKVMANKNVGVKESTNSILNDKPVNPKVLRYDQVTESCVEKLSKILPDSKISKRFYALMILEKNKYIIQDIQSKLKNDYKKIQAILEEYKNVDFPTSLRNQRIQFIEKILNECIKKVPEKNKNYFQKINKTRQRKIDRVILNGWIGIPLLILLLLAIYYLSFGPYAGGTLQKLLSEDFFRNIVCDKWLSTLFLNIFHANQWTTELFVNGIFSGFFTIISFCVLIVILFTLVNLIQQVGIISRISILLDRTFNKFGLSGRSVVNLMTGFGCNVPSILMARSSNSKKEKIVSILISPFISCSARAIVFSIICDMIFGMSLGWIGVILLLLVSGLIALLLGLFFSKTMFRKNKSFFFVEMVDWRKPDFVVIMKNVWFQLKDFIIKASTIILIANFIIWLFSHVGPSGLLTSAQIDQSLFGYIAYGLNYLMYPFGANTSLGFVGNPDGWKMTLSLVTAFPAKEIAISNISTLFGSTETFQTFIRANIPIGISYMVILLLYLPCAATISIMHKEGNWKLVFIHIATSLTISYVLSLITYWVSFGIVIAH